MNKKKHHVSLRLSEEDRSRLEALKGDYSLSYTIRDLIHKSFSEGFKMPHNNQPNRLELDFDRDRHAGKKLSEIEKQIGMEAIIKQLDTWGAIEAFLRTFRTKKSNNFHTYKKRYLEKYEELNRK